MKEPKIEFPCDYPIKVIGAASTEFAGDIIEIVRGFDETVTAEKVTERPSKKGNYVSLTICLRATGESQLSELFKALKTLPAVQMVL